MERLPRTRNIKATVAGLALIAMTASCDSRGADIDEQSRFVQCDTAEAVAELKDNSSTSFAVQGKELDDNAIVTVSRSDLGVSATAEGDTDRTPQKQHTDNLLQEQLRNDIPQEQQTDHKTSTIPETSGPELTVYAASSAWLIDATVGDDTVSIVGSCE